MDVHPSLKITFFTFLILLFFNISCSNKKDIKILKVSIAKSKNLLQSNKVIDTKPTLRVIVSSMISPKETRIYYQDLFTYMSKKLDYNIMFLQRKTYKEVNSLLINDKVDLAIICSGAYVDKSAKDKIEILTVPLVDNKPFYQSYIIANKDSGIKHFIDLKGKKFAYTDPLSNSGNLYPKWLIFKLNKNPNTFFSKTIYTYGHDISMQLVAKGIVEGASVDALIYNYYKKFYPERLKNLKIIDRSPNFGIPPLVIPKNLNKEVKLKLKKFFLNIDKDSIGSKILKKLLIDKFMIGYDKNYNSIRQMNQDLKQ